MADAPPAVEEINDGDGIYIDGNFYGYDDLTFGEQRKVRQLVRDANADDPNFKDEDMAVVDLVPALVTVIKQRDEPDFSFAQALDLKFSDLNPPSEDGEDPPTEEG